MNEMKEQKEIKVKKEDINSFFEAVITLAIVEVIKTANELIKIIIEDKFNKKEETEREIN